MAYPHTKKRRLFGFTLLELMVVVFIIGILAATAIPLVDKYLKKSKTSEAPLNLRKIYDGETAYYQEEHTDSAGINLTKVFLSNPLTPSVPTSQKQLGNFETGNWPLLKFSPDGPVFFSYSTNALGSGLLAAFTATANGDLDADNTTSLFTRVGSVNSQSGEVEGGAAIYQVDPIE